MAKVKLTAEEYAELCADFPALADWRPNGSTDWKDLTAIFGGALPNRLMWSLVDYHKKDKGPKLSQRAAAIADRFR